MTATTDTVETATVEFAEEHGWDAVRRANSGEFGEGHSWTTLPNDRGSLGLAIANVVRTMSRDLITNATVEQIREAIIAGGYAMRTASDRSLDDLRRAVLAILDDMTPVAPDTSTPEDKASRRKTGLRIIHESAWHVNLWLSGYVAQQAEEAWEAIVETALYQFDNWSRGVYLAVTEQARVDQYERRLSRQGLADNLTTRGRRIIREVLNRLWVVSQGEDAKDKYGPVPSATEFFSDLAKRWQGPDGQYAGGQGVGQGHQYWGWSDGGYYAGVALEYWIDGFDGNTEERQDWTVENFKYYIDQYSASGRADQYDQTRLEQFIEHVNAVANVASDHEAEEVKSVEALIEMLLKNESSLPDFYVAAITNGAHDLVDRFREGEQVENPVSTLRREVRKYGYLKFSGRGWTRGVLDQTLVNLRDEVAGRPLEADELRARHERFKMAVQYVAGRYGEIQDMCSVLEKATGELGLEPIRKPKRVARIEGDGLVVDVPVETWRDSTSGLMDHAQRAWSQMTPQQKEDAIVSRVGVHVNWSAMRSAF